MLRRIGKTKKIIAKMLAILGIVCVGFGVSYGFMKSNAPEPIVIQETKDLKVEVNEIKVEEVKSALQKVMVHEVNMNETHTYKSDGWFTKDTIAKYYFDVMFSLDFSICVISFEKASLSTAKACPAGTLCLYATLSNSLPNSVNSLLNTPDAVFSSSLLNELLQTISA